MLVSITQRGRSVIVSGKGSTQILDRATVPDWQVIERDDLMVLPIVVMLSASISHVHATT